MNGVLLKCYISRNLSIMIKKNPYLDSKNKKIIRIYLENMKKFVTQLWLLKKKKPNFGKNSLTQILKNLII